MAMRVVRKVPETRGQMPKCLSLNSGVHSVSPKNWANETSRKNPTLSENSV